MTINPGRISGGLLEAYAQAAVDNRRDADALLESTNRQAENAIREQTALKQHASQMRQTQEVVSAVSQAGSLAKQGASMAKGAQQAGTQSDIRQGLNQGAEDLADVDLGNGQTVGDRFTDEQLDLLTRGEFTEQELREAGFSEGQVEQLKAATEEDGRLSTDEAVDFIYANRDDPDVLEAEQRADKRQGALLNLFNTAKQAHGQGTESGVEDAQEGQRAIGHDLEMARARRAELTRLSYQSTMDLLEAKRALLPKEEHRG